MPLHVQLDSFRPAILQHGPPLPVSPGQAKRDPGIHGFSCFSPWMPHRVRHDISFPVIPGLDPGIHLLLKVFMDAASSAA
ncbi:hypothetical protein [Prosthecochloris sp.]|uniref:hypothetical protein n=1 Tax=Prosthecochloris sp. TaxID=290513 RepID=UPI00257A0D80|nr:hypothetical protein [Prosthecochloris sp.]